MVWAPAASPGALQDQSLTTDSSRTWALVIGISNYVHAEPLRYAADDAEAVAAFVKSLRGGGIPEDQVFVVTEDQATRAGVLIAIHTLQNKVQRGDTVTIYFAGHGFTQNRTGYFIPIDGALDTAFMTGIDFPHIKDLIESGLAHANTRILLTDMCNAGRVGVDQSAAATEIQNLINQDLINLNSGAGGFLNLLASQPYESSFESDMLEQGVFTFALLEALNGGAVGTDSSIVTASDIVPFVQAEVASITNNQQNPVANTDFDPGLVLSYLDRPGPVFPPPALITSLILTNASQAGYHKGGVAGARIGIESGTGPGKRGRGHRTQSTGTRRTGTELLRYRRSGTQRQCRVAGRRKLAGHRYRRNGIPTGGSDSGRRAGTSDGSRTASIGATWHAIV